MERLYYSSSLYPGPLSAECIRDSVCLYRTIKDEIPRVPLTNRAIVLDLDSTLVSTRDADLHTLRDTGILSNPQLLPLRLRTYHLQYKDVDRGFITNFWGVTRPHVDEFLLFCFAYFRVVAVWSAGKRQYVEAMVDYLFRNLPQPHIVFTRDDIEYLPSGKMVKPLTKMLETDVCKREGITMERIVIIDDNAVTFSLNPDNAVYISEYDPSNEISDLMKPDEALLQIKYWFFQPEVLSASDIRDLIKPEIFKFPADFYRQRAGL